MTMPSKPAIRDNDRIDVRWDYDVCVWARHFNVSEGRVKEAVAAVGDRALRVREHLQRSGTGSTRHAGSASNERPSGA